MLKLLAIARYVIAVTQDGLNMFKSIADRERCSFSVVGKLRGKPEAKTLVLMDRESKQYPKPIDLPISVLFGKPPEVTRAAESRKLHLPAFDSSLATYLPKTSGGIFDEVVDRVLALPAVGSKMFLVTIGDRTGTRLLGVSRFSC